MSAESVTPAILFTLSPEAARVMGCLIEKEITLPDYYPMTLNALVTACNQTTNRDPIVRYDERTVLRALESMKSHGYVFEVNVVGGRTLKYRHNLKGKLPGLDRSHMALLCMLMLRGSQTAGELRQRTERLFEFPDMQSVENTLAELIGYNEGPLVQCIPAGPGQRVAQFMHLLCGEVAGAPGTGLSSHAPAAPPAEESSTSGADAEWRAKMEAEISLLKAQVSRLQTLIGAVK
ncbi:YceH family protein [Prosthecobacter sp.]|uniref:YceH family protein n=1 Tax=Prosthecobacter sp. TaxID=1965333 RepID=UPI003784DF45